MHVTSYENNLLWAIMHREQDHLEQIRAEYVNLHERWARGGAGYPALEGRLDTLKEKLACAEDGVAVFTRLLVNLKVGS